MNDFVELRKILAIALRWWWLLVIVTAVGVGAGYAYSNTQTPIYRATATLLVGQSIQAIALDSKAITAGEQLALTYANIIRLQPVMNAVVEKLDLSLSWQSLAQQVRATPVENTQLLRISADGESPEEATAIADEVANTLIQLSSSTLQNQVLGEDLKFTQQRLETLRTNISEGQKKIDDLEARISQATRVDELQSIQQDIDSVQKLVADWENNYSRLLDFSNQSTSPNVLSVVEPAQASSTPIYPVTLVNMLAVGLVAFAFTASLLILMEFMQESPDTLQEILENLELTSLGSVGTLKGKKLPDSLIIKNNLFSSVSEDYRLLRSKLQFLATRWQRKVLLVTGVISNELQGVVSANLGIVMAQAGLKTIIIDTNLRHPSQHQLFELSNEKGLADSLYAVDEDSNGYLQETSVQNLKVLTTGSVSTLYPTELLSSARMQKLLDHLAKQADIILCTSAEVAHYADTMVLSSMAEGVVVVLDGSKNERSQTPHAILNLKQAGTNLIGVVIQTAKASSALLKPVPSATLRSNGMQFSIQSNGNHGSTSYTNGKESKVHRSSEF